MTVVLVHGVPETPALWDGLRAHLRQESVALRLPGFGAARPETMKDKEAYAAWLAAELRAIGEPVDLVGHDWGGHLAMRIVSAYPEVAVRSWVSDVAYGWHPDYEWHDVAKLWQKSPEGEESLAGLRAGQPGTFGQLLAARGMSEEAGRDVDAAHDEGMSAAILALYRSAQPNFHADWGAAVAGPVAAPGLVLVPTADAMDGGTQNDEIARSWGARVVRLEGLSHYWMVQDPERAAGILDDFYQQNQRFQQSQRSQQDQRSQ
jgi:pimeloyl-ACP methyl ester carboxylesterase